MTAHHRTECKHGTVIGQCRCPGPKVVTVVDPCPFPEHRSLRHPPLSALEWLRVTHNGTLSGRRIEEAVTEAEQRGYGLGYEQCRREMSRVERLPCGWIYDPSAAAVFTRHPGNGLPLKLSHDRTTLVTVDGGDQPDGRDGAAAAAHLVRDHPDDPRVRAAQPVELYVVGSGPLDLEPEGCGG